MRNASHNAWPPLPYDEWKDTIDTLHMYMQIVGKVKLALSPFLNQWWQVAFHFTSRGITTGRIDHEGRVLEIEFDFIIHQVFIRTSDGRVKIIALRPLPVAEFYEEFMSTLSGLGIDVKIRPIPTEVPNPIPFKQDFKHASYDEEYVERWWRIQLRVASLFDQFRTPFRGKSSPIQFFWGSFDLNGTRFNGQRATPPDMQGEFKNIMKYAENEENFAFGFWPGNERYPHSAFYSYIYPAPKEIEKVDAGPGHFDATLLSEFILDYEDVIKAEKPEEMIMEFLKATYEGSAKLAGWDVEGLLGPVP